MNFISPDFHRAIVDDFHARLEQSHRRGLILQGIDPDNEPTTFQEAPRSAEWLAARTEFVARWNALIREGLNNDFLEKEPDNGYVVTTDTSEWVEIPNPDYDPGKPNPYAIREGVTTITIPIAKPQDDE